MFKIESYITPLLMGYLDKYVKLRPDDFQLSLWGGDAVLYNLDLRLDIIERAMQLPIVFQSGHIHELRLHVPWTKLGSDPVVVTINTIECILKVRDTAYKEHGSRRTYETPRKSGQKIRKPESVDLPPGYLQSLMNKIVNNVSIIVNNLIVKFVEDDIVLSLNVKSAECYSVDNDWNRAFVELLAPDYVLRRTVNFCDVTLCLDKRDASGKIDNYQDPLIYRCSVASRLYTKYENMHSKYPLETKMNVYCERLDLSLTDIQLPMLIRLIELCMALYYGTLEFKTLPSEDESSQQDVDRESMTESSVGEPPPGDDEYEQGWASWAWSYVPQIMIDEDDEEYQVGPPKKPPILIFSLGLYGFKFTIKFKLTESMREKAHYGPRKIAFKPFLYLECDGISMELLMQGLTFFDIQFGVTSVAMYSLGSCICGAEGEENSRNNVLLSGGDSLQNKMTTNYICQSLFDLQSPENLGIPIAKILDFDEHRQVYTEQYAAQKFGFFWLDSLYSMVKPEEKRPNTSSKSSVSSLDESTVFVQENALMTFVVGQCHLNVCSTTVHRIQKILDAAYKYDYEPYSKPVIEKVDEGRPHPTEEQMKSLEEYIPTRTYHLTLLQPIISILSAEHAYCDVSKKTYRSLQQKVTSQRFDLQFTKPMYSRKLVQLVSKIAGPSSNLLHHCHSHTQMKLFGFQVGLMKVDSSGSRSPILTIVPPANGAMYTKRLLLTMYWTNSYLPKFEKVYELPQVSLSISKPAVHVAMAIVSSWKQNNPKPADIMSSSLLDDVFLGHDVNGVSKHAVLEVTLAGLEMKSCRNEMVTACSATVSSLHTVLYKYDGQKTSAIPILSCPCDTDSIHTTDWLTGQYSSVVEEVKNDFLMLTYQLPQKYDQVQAPAIVLVNVEGMAVCLSPVLQTWLSYKPVTRILQSGEPQVELDLNLAKLASPLQTNLSQVSVPSSGSKRQTLSLTRTPTTGQQSTQPAGNQDHKPPENQESSGIGEKLAKIFPLIRVLQVQVEMKKACIFLPKHHLEVVEQSTNIVGNFQAMARSRSLSDTLVVCLPRVVVQSAGMKPMSAVQDIPITSTEVSLVGDKIPWNVSLQNCCVYTIHNAPFVRALQLVKPATVSSTVGVSYKYTPPTSDTISALGLCLHTDMRSVTLCTSMEQVKLLLEIASTTVQLATQTVNYLAEVSKCTAAEDGTSKSVTEPSNYQNVGQTFPAQTVSAGSVSQSDIPYTQTSGDLTSLDTPSRELEILETSGEGVKLSLWLQWTLPRFEMRLYLKGKQGETKISALVEDITVSVDVQDVYSKLKLNLGTAGISHFQRESGTSRWQKGIQEGILMSCRDNLSHDTHIVSSRLWSGDHRSSSITMFQGNQPQREITHGFCSLTFTRALRKNVKKRLQKLNIDTPNMAMNGGDLLNQFYFHKFVSEVCVTIAPCDFILCMAPVAVVLSNLSLIELPKQPKSANIRSPLAENEASLPVLTASNLPLLYTDISNVRVFVPGEVTPHIAKGDNITTTIQNDMFLLQVQSVNITPNVDNPLPRYAVDKELFHRAVHLGITTESGAALADKQYQVDIKGLSITSGCWSDFTKQNIRQGSSSIVAPGTQIPAVEWNSLSIREEPEDTQLFPMLSPCDLKLVLAPALVNYTTLLGYTELKANLVCGYGLEFNAVSDLDLHISTNQIHLVDAKLAATLKTLKSSAEHCDEHPEENNSVLDSGIGSEVSAVTGQRSMLKHDVKGQGQSKTHMKMSQTPVDLLLTAGRISCTVYSHTITESEIKREAVKPNNSKKKKRSKRGLNWRVTTSPEEDNVRYDETDNQQDPYLMHMYQLDKNNEKNAIRAGTTCIKPFLFFYISQPHTVLSSQPDHQKFEMSCYDILVKGSPEHSLFPVCDVRLLPDCSDFTEYWLETRAGHPHPSTGIPASLVTLTVADFLNNQAKICLKIERPVRTNVSFSKIRHVQDFYGIVFPRQLQKSEKVKTSPKASSNESAGTLAILSSVNIVDLQLDQVVVALETKLCAEKPEVLTSFSSFKGHLEFQHTDNGVVDSVLFSSYMRDVLVKTVYESRQLNMIGPCSVKLDGSYTRISQAGSDVLSQYMVTMATGLVTLQFGQENALCLKLVADHLARFYKELTCDQGAQETRRAPVNAETTKAWPAHFVTHTSNDDLRSGEFQYVMDTDGADVVPRPGEIVFCTRDREGNSSMTWSYSESRVISAVSSTPVPFNVTEVEAGEENKVDCVLQYWEALVQQFIDLVDIELLESEVTQVVLPDVRANSARDLVAAQIWRVVIRNPNGEAVFPPASLAASMKVDSCFIPSLIPVMQIGLTMESVQLHLINHVHCLGQETPSKLCPFSMSSCYQPTGQFAVISLNNVLAAGSQWNGQQARNQLQFSSEMSVDVLEYKTLTMEKVISPFEFSGTCSLQPIPKSPVLDVEITCEPVTIRIGQGIVHNLDCSLQAWNQILTDDPSELPEIVFSHYVICNNTQQPIRFGQVGTDENLVLQAREMHQYGWRSHKMRQELHICLDGPVWKWCDAVDMNTPATFVRSVSSTDKQYTLVICVTRISNVQYQVIISGLVTVSNRLSLPMEVKVVTMETEHHAVAGAEHTIPTYVLEPHKIQGIMFRCWGSNGPWSKEVYVCDSSVKENNLVKITSGSRIVHIWCRVIVHTVQNIQQIFVVLCPLYTVRSHLPYPLFINIDTSKLNIHEQIEAPGRGRDLQLQCPGGDVHQSLTFQFSANSGKSSTSVTLSTGLIEQLQKPTIEDFKPDDLNDYWKNDTWFEWPYSQNVIIEGDSPKPGLYSVTVPELDTVNQPTIDLNVNLSALWPGFQTLLVDVTPSFIINNHCQLDLVFMGMEDVTYDVRRGCSICPPKFESSFHVGVKNGDSVHMSESVPVSEEAVEDQRYRLDLGKTLYIDSSVNMPIFADYQGRPQVYFLTIRSRVKHQMRVITIQEQYVMTNLTKYRLQACVFSVPTWSNKVDIPIESSVRVNSHLGCPRDTSDLQPLTFLPLQYVPSSQQNSDIDQDTNLVNYLVLKNVVSNVENGTDSSIRADGRDICEPFTEVPLTKCNSEFDWTFPVRLAANESGCRMTTSLSVWQGRRVKQEAVCVTGQEKKGVTYFTIQEDTAPICFIQNHCPFPLYFGQTLMNLSISGTTIQEQTELINTLPTIPVDGAVYYTPPFLNTTFPQIKDKHSIPKLHISGSLPSIGVEKESSEVKWSNPIDLLVAADNFVSIPSIADVKVHVQQVAMVTHVTISPITKADVSAREIRSRLKGKDRTVVVESATMEHSDEKIAAELKYALEMSTPNNVKSNETDTTAANSALVSFGLLLHRVSFVVQNEAPSLYTKGEIMRLTLDDLFVATYPASDLVQQTGHHRKCVVFSIGDMQVDNQIQSQGNYDFAVVFIRQDSKDNAYHSDHFQLSQMNILEKHAVLKSNSIVHAQVVFGYNCGRPTVIESVEYAMQPACFYIDDTFIFRCIKELEGYVQVPLVIPEPLPVDVLKLPPAVKSLSRMLSHPVTIGHLIIQPLSVMFSIHASMKVFIASDHAPLSFGKFEKMYLCTTGYQLVRVLAMHYASGALFRAGAVVGSLEILGNPTGLVRSIGTGVADFFRMPYRGLTQGPGAFVVGVSHGTSSMLKNITTGMLKSVTDFASSVSRNMDRLSLDDSHMRRQEESRRHRPDSMSDGLKQGLTGLGINLLGAIAGLADQPIQNLVEREAEGQSRTSAASGLVTGVGKGLVGVFTKPIGGAAEFVSQTGQGILQGTGLSRMPSPRVKPYVIDISSAPCGQVKYALKLLQTLPSNDILCCIEARHIDLLEQDVSVTLILTPEILFVVNHEEDSQQQSFSILELECGASHGEQSLLSIIWKDSQTFGEEQHEPSKKERVTAFVDAATRYIATECQLVPDLTEHSNVMQTNTQHDKLSQAVPASLNKLHCEDFPQGRQSGSEMQGEQLSDTVSESSTEAVCDTLPQYDFKMSATNLAAFLAIFNITKHKLTGIGFLV